MSSYHTGSPDNVMNLTRWERGKVLTIVARKHSIKLSDLCRHLELANFQRPPYATVKQMIKLGLLSKTGRLGRYIITANETPEVAEAIAHYYDSLTSEVAQAHQEES